MNRRTFLTTMMAALVTGCLQDEGSTDLDEDNWHQVAKVDISAARDSEFQTLALENSLREIFNGETFQPNDVEHITAAGRADLETIKLEGRELEADDLDSEENVVHTGDGVVLLGDEELVETGFFGLSSGEPELSKDGAADVLDAFEEVVAKGAVYSPPEDTFTGEETGVGFATWGDGDKAIVEAVLMYPSSGVADVDEVRRIVEEGQVPVVGDYQPLVEDEGDVVRLRAHADFRDVYVEDVSLLSDFRFGFGETVQGEVEITEDNGDIHVEVTHIGDLEQVRVTFSSGGNRVEDVLYDTGDSITLVVADEMGVLRTLEGEELELQLEEEIEVVAVGMSDIDSEAPTTTGLAEFETTV